MLRAHDYDEVNTYENVKNAMLSKDIFNIPTLNDVQTTEKGKMLFSTGKISTNWA